jgi:hypothetical protein
MASVYHGPFPVGSDFLGRIDFHRSSGSRSGPKHCAFQ